MNTKTERRFKNGPSQCPLPEDLVRRHWSARGYETERRCPSCGSLDLKKVPFVYEQGLSRTTARSRWSGFVLGDVATGHAVAWAIHESELSTRLRPPVKWSYRRLFLNTVVIAIVLLIVCVHIVMDSASVASGLRIALVGGVGFGALVAAFFAIWRQNQMIYPRRLAEWQKLFVCQRCGAVSKR